MSVVTDFLTVAEAAAALRLTPRTIRRWVADGKLDAIILPSGRVRIPTAAIAPYVNHESAS